MPLRDNLQGRLIALIVFTRDSVPPQPWRPDKGAILVPAQVPEYSRDHGRILAQVQDTNSRVLVAQYINPLTKVVELCVAQVLLPHNLRREIPMTRQESDSARCNGGKRHGAQSADLDDMAICTFAAMPHVDTG